MTQPEVKTIYGKIRGSVENNCEGIDFYAFKGIPYAKPPIGKLRFKDPVKPEPWTTIADATKFGPMCAQFDLMTQVIDGSDDCLYLNVYTQSVNENIRRPVMFYIHGGGFIHGSGDDLFYGPDYLMKKDIVLVTINYRLGIFGFLNLQHKIAPGNQGLKDQVMALKWVRDNIAQFGGDPNNVTIFGESAGGASVHYLTLSPLSKGLFHKAISQSGVAINPWASVLGDPKEIVYKICKRLGKDTTDPDEIVKFLQTVDALKLIELQKEFGFPEIQSNILATFGPCVDDKSSTPFMPTSIEIASAKQGAHVPYILGHTDREGGFMITGFENSTDPETKDKNFKKLIHPQIQDMLKNNNMTTDELKRLYFKNGIITLDNLDASSDLVGDLFFNLPTHKVIKAQVEHNSAPTYFYQFTFDQGYSILKLMHNLPKRKGSAHLDDLIYLFKMKFLEKFNVDVTKKGSQNHRVMEQMIEMWTNFAKTGNPTFATSELLPTRWLPVTDGTVFRYLNIGEDLRMEKMLNIEERYSYKKDQ